MLDGLQSMGVKQSSNKPKGRTPEGKVKAEIRKIFEDRDVYYVMPVTGGYGRSGVPDFIACYNGRFIAVEAKSKHTKHGVTSLQRQNLKAIENAGGTALVIDEDSYDDLIDRLGG